MRANVDEDALLASIDVVRRAGAKEFQVGYLHDDVPVDQAGWWAFAQYRGARISVDDHRGPVEAVEALARRLLDGALCRRCGNEIALGGDAGGGYCRWRRVGAKWEPGCGQPIDLSIPAPLKEGTMRKTMIVCDSCDNTFDPEKISTAVVTVEIAGVKRVGDLCERCAGKIPTSAIASKPGRKPKAKPAVRARGEREQAETLEDALAVSR